MATRTAYGNSFSENGWPMVDEGSCQWIAVPGTSPEVSLEIQQGIPVALLRAWAADINAFVQKLRDADSACWTLDNDVATSNHLSGTAEDLDWDDHPMGPEYAGWSPDQITTIRQMLQFYTYKGIQMVWWGEDWDSPKDSMHFQVGYNTYSNQDICNEFIANFITADGFSAFRRGVDVPTAPVPAPPAADAASILAQATGLPLSKATEILPTMEAGLKLAQCNTVNRIAMFIAQTQEESDNYNTTEEYGDLSGEAFYPFIGRTWIQVTWESNYQAFGQWATQQGLITDPNQFVNDPGSLADIQWAGIGAAWYWTVQRPQINSLCDNGDIVGVTEAINGGTNGLDARTSNWNRALSVGDQLLTLTEDEDDMFTDADRNLLQQISDIRRPSLSPLRWPNEGDVNTCAGFAWTADANIHVLLIEKLSVEYGDASAIALLYAVTNNSDPARADDAKLADRILAKVNPGDLALANDKIQQWLNAEKAA